MTSRPAYLCHLCGEPVDLNSRRTYELVIGWGRRGRAGGSDIVNRRGTGKFAHPTCVDRERSNVHANQETLV